MRHPASRGPLALLSGDGLPRQRAVARSCNSALWPFRAPRGERDADHARADSASQHGQLELRALRRAQR
jgi:hypothetical protein